MNKKQIDDIYIKTATQAPKFCLLFLSNLLQKTNSRTGQKTLSIKEKKINQHRIKYKRVFFFGIPEKWDPGSMWDSGPRTLKWNLTVGPSGGTLV